MPDLGAPELIIIAIVMMILFGANRLPKVARSVGQSLRILKTETAALRDDDDAERKSDDGR